VTRVTLDTSELISAFNFRDKFEWNPYELRALHDSLMKICKHVEPKHILAVVADEPDNRILECSEEAGSEFIITEDRALLRVIGILSPDLQQRRRQALSRRRKQSFL